jgi:hypothetical protein
MTSRWFFREIRGNASWVEFALEGAERCHGEEKVHQPYVAKIPLVNCCDLGVVRPKTSMALD